jgi:hypothetical protein
MPDPTRFFRSLAPVTLIVLTCSAVASLQEKRAIDSFGDLDKFVDGERLTQQLPGLAVVIVCSDGQPRRMHLGSLTKAITH